MCQTAGTIIAVVNANFEADTGIVGDTPTGWSVQQAQEGSFYVFGSGSGFRFQASFSFDDVVSQAVTGLVAGCKYQLSFDLSAVNTPYSFTPSVDNTVLRDSSGNSLAQTSFASVDPVTFIGVFTAASTTPTLSFAGRNSNGYVGLSGVSLKALGG